MRKALNLANFFFITFIIFTNLFSSCNSSGTSEQKNDTTSNAIDSDSTTSKRDCQLNIYQWKVDASIYKTLNDARNPRLRKIALTPLIKDFITKFNIDAYTYAWGKDNGTPGTKLDDNFGVRGNIGLTLDELTPPIKFSEVEFRRQDINTYLDEHGIHPDDANNDLWFLPFIDSTETLNYYLVPIPKNSNGFSDTSVVKNFLPDSIRVTFPNNLFITFTFTGATRNGLAGNPCPPKPPANEQ